MEKPYWWFCDPDHPNWAAMDAYRPDTLAQQAEAAEAVARRLARPVNLARKAYTVVSSRLSAPTTRKGAGATGLTASIRNTKPWSSR